MQAPISYPKDKVNNDTQAIQSKRPKQQGEETTQTLLKHAGPGEGSTGPAFRGKPTKTRRLDLQRVNLRVGRLAGP